MVCVHTLCVHGSDSLTVVDVLLCDGIPSSQPKPGVYGRGTTTTTLGTGVLANIQGGQRGQKIMEALIADLTAIWPGAPNPPRVATRAVCGSWLALRNEIAALHELRRTRLPGGGLSGVADGQKGSKKRR